MNQNKNNYLKSQMTNSFHCVMKPNHFDYKLHWFTSSVHNSIFSYPHHAFLHHKIQTGEIENKTYSESVINWSKNEKKKTISVSNTLCYISIIFFCESEKNVYMFHFLKKLQQCFVSKYFPIYDTFNDVLRFHIFS